MAEVRPGVWRLRVYVGRKENGQPIQVTKTVRGPEERTGSGKRMAQRELAAMVAKASSSTTSRATTVNELLDQWLAHLETLGRSPTTLREYRAIARRVVRPELGTVKVRALTARQLDTLYAKLTAKGNKATTVRRVHALIGAALHQAEKWDMVEFNVARKATPPPVRTEPVKAPSPDDVRAIVAAADELDPGLANLLLLGALTGARRGELCALRWNDLAFHARLLAVQEREIPE